MSYETAINKLVEMSTHANDYDKNAKYPYYVSANDAFFEDKQIILCKNISDAKHVAKALEVYNMMHKGMRKMYSYISIGTTENFRPVPRQKYGVLFDNDSCWWNYDAQYASLRGCHTSVKHKVAKRK